MRGAEGTTKYTQERSRSTSLKWWVSVCVWRVWGRITFRSPLYHHTFSCRCTCKTGRHSLVHRTVLTNYVVDGLIPHGTEGGSFISYCCWPHSKPWCRMGCQWVGFIWVIHPSLSRWIFVIEGNASWSEFLILFLSLVYTCRILGLSIDCKCYVLKSLFKGARAVKTVKSGRELSSCLSWPSFFCTVQPGG